MENYNDLTEEEKIKTLERFISCKDKRIKHFDTYLKRNGLKRDYISFRTVVSFEDVVNFNYWHRKKAEAVEGAMNILTAFSESQEHYRKLIQEFGNFTRNLNRKEMEFTYKFLKVKIKFIEEFTEDYREVFVIGDKQINEMKAVLKHHEADI